VSTLSELLADHSELTGEVVEHLQRVVAEWQLLADMSFADFLLWVPLSPIQPGPASAATAEFLCIAQARPTTAPTAHA
jgi:two-component system, sensor histidine kinase PdtaS